MCSDMERYPEEVVKIFKKKEKAIYNMLFVCKKEENRAFLVAQMVKNPTAMLEIQVQSLGWEDPLEKGKSTHSSILAWRIPWTVAYQAPPSMGFSRQEYWSGLPFHSPTGERSKV